MGIGKTTFSKKLAKKLNFNFFDLDYLIKEKISFSILEIFKKYGEDYFRQIENQTLKNFIESNNDFVLACGGGTPCFYNNIQIINDSGISVLLELKPKMILRRLQESKTERPLLENLSEEAKLNRITELLTEREQYYSQAKIKINAFDCEIKKVVEEIIQSNKDNTQFNLKMNK